MYVLLHCGQSWRLGQSWRHNSVHLCMILSLWSGAKLRQVKWFEAQHLTKSNVALQQS